MLTGFIPSIIAGAVCGVLSGMGIGGGSLLMIWMTTAASLDQKLAQGINLLYFIPTALGSFFFHWKQKTIAWNAVLPAVLAGCCMAAVSSIVSISMNVEFLRKLFGVFLLIVGITELKKKD